MRILSLFFSILALDSATPIAIYYSNNRGFSPENADRITPQPIKSGAPHKNGWIPIYYPDIKNKIRTERNNPIVVRRDKTTDDGIISAQFGSDDGKNNKTKGGFDAKIDRNEGIDEKIQQILDEFATRFNKMLEKAVNETTRKLNMSRSSDGAPKTPLPEAGYKGDNISGTVHYRAEDGDNEPRMQDTNRKSRVTAEVTTVEGGRSPHRYGHGYDKGAKKRYGHYDDRKDSMTAPRAYESGSVTDVVGHYGDGSAIGSADNIKSDYILPIGNVKVENLIDYESKINHNILNATEAIKKRDDPIGNRFDYIADNILPNRGYRIIESGNRITKSVDHKQNNLLSVNPMIKYDSKNTSTALTESVIHTKNNRLLNKANSESRITKTIDRIPTRTIESTNTNSAINRLPKPDTIESGSRITKSIHHPIYRPTYGHNIPDQPSPDPYVALFLSHYGKYLPGVHGIGTNYRNLYSYLASNNPHNNMPFGSYKIYEDADG